MGKVKEKMQIDIDDLIYEVPDGLDRIPILKIQECKDFLDRYWIDYLCYLDHFYDYEQVERICMQEVEMKDYLCYLLNHHYSRLEVIGLREDLGEYVKEHYEYLMIDDIG